MKKSMLGVLIPFLAFVLTAAVVMLERYGVIAEYEPQELVTETIDEYSDPIESTPECLVILNDENSQDVKMIRDVFESMRISYEEMDVIDLGDYSVLDSYDKVVIALTEWSEFGNNVFKITDWVYNGGNLMNVSTPEVDTVFKTVMPKLGVDNNTIDYTEVNGLSILDNCMIGARNGEVYELVDPGEEFKTSLNIVLSNQAKAYVVSESGKVPLIWKAPYGKGNFVITNYALSDKMQRGFTTLAYSLLGDSCVYPVINGSVFYLDDFPSPVPGGDSHFIFRDYGVSTATFYSTIWWPQMMRWEEKYGLKHTGLIIADYSDQVKAPFATLNTDSEFVQFGNMLINNGGELGFHGLNHMPLCLEGVDDDMQYGDYELWPSTDDMKASLEELYRYSKKAFPSQSFSTYVPPSNILSDTGRQALVESCPNIKIIAASYVPDDSPAREQEFCVEEDGIINVPRITSGCMIGNYEKLTQMSELNFHYAQSHFTHPDDTLDEDRGAAEGWAAMASSFEGYLDWFYGCAPTIRNLTGSQMGKAVEQYYNLSVQKTEDDNGISVSLGGFSNEAYLMLRINGNKIKSSEGCDFEEVANHLYIIHATKPNIRINY